MDAQLDDVLAVEEGAETLEEQAVAMQRLINSGTCWSLQGSFGRAAMDMLEDGLVMLGPEPGRDYWGNRIPSRHEVKEGTKGSRGLVVERHGEDWAVMLDKVDEQEVGYE